MTVSAVCQFKGCDKPKKSYGLCNGHNEQRRLGKELKPLRTYGTYGQCEVMGCERLARASGVCRKCYGNERRNMNRSRAVTALGGACHDCGGRFPDAIYDFHHRDETKKEFGLSTGWHKPWDQIESEIVKCDLLCPTCHRLRHFEMDSKPKRVAQV